MVSNRAAHHIYKIKSFHSIFIPFISDLLKCQIMSSSNVFIKAPPDVNNIDAIIFYYHSQVIFVAQDGSFP